MTPSRIPRLFEITLVSFVLGIYLYASLSAAHNFGLDWFIRDDAYYYFKVAQNITEGHGATFDGINATNGYHPLWMLINIPIFALARINIILPLRILLFISGIISAWTGVLLFRLAKKFLSAPVAMLIACYWCFDINIHYSVTMFGLETGLTALTLTALLLAIAQLDSHKPLSSRQAWTLGGLAVLTLFSRLDTVFLVGLAGVWILLRGNALRFYLMFDIAIIVTAAFTSIMLRTGLPEYFTYVRAAEVLAALGLIIQIPAFYFLGLYHPFAPNSQFPIPNSPVSNHQSRVPGLDTAENHRLLDHRKFSNSQNLKIFSLQSLVLILLPTLLVALAMIGLSSAGPLNGLPRSALPLYAGLVLVGAGGVRILSRSAHLASPIPHPAWREELSGIQKRFFNEGVKYFSAITIALTSYMLLNRWLFDTFTPVSGQIKRWWGFLQGSVYGNPVSTLAGFLGLEKEEGLNAWGPAVYSLHNLKTYFGKDASALWIALIVVILVALLILFTKPKRSLRASLGMALPLLLAASILQMFYYVGLGYAGTKDWYWVTQMILLALLGGLIVDLVTRPLRKLNWGRIAVWLAILFLCVQEYALPFANIITQRMTYDDRRAGQPYLDAAAFLEANTEPGALIGMTGGGNVSYFINGRTIVNLDGLINSFAYYQALRAGHADEFLTAMGLDYIFTNPGILEATPYAAQFDNNLTRVAIFGGKDLLRFAP